MMREFLYVLNNNNDLKGIITVLLSIDERMGALEGKLEQLINPRPKNLKPPMAPPPMAPTTKTPEELKPPVSLRGSIVDELKVLFKKREGL